MREVAFLSVAWLTVGLTVRAAPPPPASGVVAKTAMGATGKESQAGPKPGPDVKLAIDAKTTRGPWTMRLTNAGEVPVRVTADARLLSLEVTPRSARASIRCELPADMRPADDLQRTLVIPPKRSYTESFEPRLYCFGSKLEALAPGAIVVGRLGWTTGRKTEPPFAAAPIDGVEPELAPLKAIEGLPIALPDEPSAWMTSEVAASEWRRNEDAASERRRNEDAASERRRNEDAARSVETDTASLSLHGSTSVDATSPNDITVAVTLRNDGSRAAVVRFRPEVLGFEIVGPAGVEHCSWPMMPAAAMREMFTTLAPKRSETLEVSLDSYCTRHGLDRGGLIVVRPRLDTRNASGTAVGLRSFDGELTATTPTVVRLHRGAIRQPLERPHLEEEQP
jgi:hypothetical protein